MRCVFFSTARRVDVRLPSRDLSFFLLSLFQGSLTLLLLQLSTRSAGGTVSMRVRTLALVGLFPTRSPPRANNINLTASWVSGHRTLASADSSDLVLVNLAHAETPSQSLQLSVCETLVCRPEFQVSPTP